MATLQTVATRGVGTSFATGKAYFETSTNKFIVWNGSSWVELHSDGTGAVDAFNIDIVNTEATILARTGDPDGTIARVTDSSTLYVYQGGAWYIFNYDPFNQYSLSFNGSSAYLDTGSNFKSTFQSDFTIALWVKINEFGHGKALIAADSGTSYDHRFSIFTTESGNKIGSFYKAAGSGTSALFNNSSVDWATWNHVAYSYAQNGSAVDVKVYLNGSLDGSNSNVGVTLANFSESGETAKTLFLGARHGVDGEAQAFTNVNLDEVAIFSSALSAPEVASLIDSSGSNPVPANISSLTPSAWWRMGDDASDTFVDGGSVSSITDSSENDNHATQGTVSDRPTFSTSVPA